MPATSVADLVDDYLTRTNTTRPDLSAALGTSRATLWRKLSDMRTVDASFLRHLTEATGIPYGTLLRAALLDTNTVTTIGELIDGLPLTAVITTEADRPAEITDAILFTDPDAAAGYTEIAQDINTTYGRTIYRCVVTAIDPPQESLDFCTIYTAHWDNRSGIVTVSPRRTAGRPEDLGADGLSAAFTITTASSTVDGIENLIVSVSLTGDDEHTVRDALATRITELAHAGRLAPRTFNPYPGGFMDRVTDLAVTPRYTPPTGPDTAPGAGAPTTPSPEIIAAGKKLAQVPYRWGGDDGSDAADRPIGPPDTWIGPDGTPLYDSDNARFRVTRRIINETRDRR